MYTFRTTGFCSYGSFIHVHVNDFLKYICLVVVLMEGVYKDEFRSFVELNPVFWNHSLDMLRDLNLKINA